MKDSGDYALLTDELIVASDTLLAGNGAAHVDNERLERQIQLLESSSGLVDSANELMRTTGDVIDSSRDIFVCAVSAYRSVKELDAIARHHEANAGIAIAKVQFGAAMVEKKVDRCLDRCDRLLDQLLMIDVDACSDRQMKAREQLIELATKASDEAHDALMRFLTI